MNIFFTTFDISASSLRLVNYFSKSVHRLSILSMEQIPTTLDPDRRFVFVSQFAHPLLHIIGSEISCFVFSVVQLEFGQLNE